MPHDIPDSDPGLLIYRVAFKYLEQMGQTWRALPAELSELANSALKLLEKAGAVECLVECIGTPVGSESQQTVYGEASGDPDDAGFVGPCVPIRADRPIAVRRIKARLRLHGLQWKLDLAAGRVHKVVTELSAARAPRQWKLVPAPASETPKDGQTTPAAATDDDSPLAPAKSRAGRLPRAESEAKRSGMLATLRQHASLKDDPAKLADMIGVSVSTVRRWLEEETRKYLESAAARPDPDEDRDEE